MMSHQQSGTTSVDLKQQPSTLQLSSDALTAHLDDETVVLHLGTKQYFHLNVTAQRVLELIEEALTEDAIVQQICSEFDVNPNTAHSEVTALVNNFKALGLVESIS